MLNETIVIIVGLPCSGKTTYANILKDEKKMIIYDDFFREYANCSLINDIKNNINVCMNDPRLCIINNFEFIINDIIKYIDVEKIIVIIYNNNPKQCIENLKLRKHDNNTYKKIENSIKNISTSYNIDLISSYLDNRKIKYYLKDVFAPL